MLLFHPAVLGLLMLFASVVWMLRDETDRSRPLLVVAVVFNLFYGWLLNVLMGKADGLLPWKFDYYLHSVDAALGIPAATVAVAFCGLWRTVLGIAYELLLPMMILWLAVHRESVGRKLLRAYIAEMIAGPALYMVLPACGPVYAFGASWLHPPSVDPVAVRFSGMPNAFPSLHVGTALLFVLFARKTPYRIISVAFLAATVLATLTTGEHYVIDVVAGLVFGCFAAAVGNGRIGEACGYLAIAICWSIAIRFGVDALVSNPGVLRLWTAATAGIAVRGVLVEWRGAVPLKFSVGSQPAAASASKI
jgi:hypothetical protein